MPPHVAAAPPARRWYSTEKCHAGAESWGSRQYRNSWSYASVFWVSITGAKGAVEETKGHNLTSYIISSFPFTRFKSHGQKSLPCMKSKALMSLTSFDASRWKCPKDGSAESEKHWRFSMAFTSLQRKACKKRKNKDVRTPNVSNSFHLTESNKVWHLLWVTLAACTKQGASVSLSSSCV